MAWKRHKQYRLSGFDYSRNGAYFITIVSKKRQPVFGEIIDDDIRLSPIGQFVAKNIQNISLYKHDIQIDEFQIMPDHVHMIVTITGKPSDAHYEVATGLQPLIIGSVSAFINHFKGKVTRWCNEQGIEGFAWQSRFHDRVIRDDNEYRAIIKYIQNNIRYWDGGRNEYPV